MFWAVVENAEELAGRWVQVRAAVRAGMRKGVSKGVVEGASEARTKHLFTNRTGKLERSIVGRVTGSRTSVGIVRDGILRVSSSRTPLEPNDGAHFGIIEAKEKYASFVEGGRGPVIVRNAKALRFVIGGRVFFRRSVRAAKPFPFMAFAYFKCEAVMIREIELGVAEAQAILDR